MKNLNSIIGAVLTFFIICLATVGMIFLAACGSTNGISTVGNPDYELPEGKKAFYSAAMNVAPVIEATTLSEAALTTAFESGNPIYEVFNAFREYLDSRDSGVIDSSNIYKLLFDAAIVYDMAITEVTALATPTAIPSPFDFGNTPPTYTDASDNYAMLRNGDTIHALLTWTWDESPTMSYGIIEGNFNDTTGNVTLDMVYLVDYPLSDEPDYCLRTHISGNEDTHQFTMKAAKYNIGTDSYAVSMIGTGISQSNNVDDHFLLKIIDNDNLAGYSGGRYYKFSAGADETELRAHPIDGYASGEFTDPNNYASIITEIANDPSDGFFALDGSDHATSANDFPASILGP